MKNSRRDFLQLKSKQRFSNIGFDHAHEQNNKTVKTEVGAIGILDSPSALLKWAVAGPEISRILGIIHEDGEDEAVVNHHEDTDNFETKLETMLRNSILHLVNLGIHSRSLGMVC